MIFINKLSFQGKWPNLLPNPWKDQDVLMLTSVSYVPKICGSPLDEC